MRMAGFRNLKYARFYENQKSVEQRNAHYTALQNWKPPTIFEKTKMYSQRMEIQREPKGGGSWGKLAPTPRLLCYARLGRASSTWPHPPLLDWGGVQLRGQKIISLPSVLNKRDFQKEPAGWLDRSPLGGHHLSKQNSSWANYALGFQYLPAMWPGWKEEGETLASGEKKLFFQLDFGARFCRPTLCPKKTREISKANTKGGITM